MTDSRTTNTKRNIIAGIIYRLVAILFPFLNRTIILWTLGAEFTGLSSLFISILEVLSIAELGFNSAVVYSLYEPIVHNNFKRINELVSLIRIIYKYVGFFILIVGLCITPFITNIISGSYPETINIYAVYILYLINTVISYFLFAYKEVLLIAYQRKDIADNIRCIVNVFRYIAQFATIIITKNFYLFLIVSILGTIVTNLIIQHQTTKRYAFYSKVPYKVDVPQDIKNQVKGLLIDRLCNSSRHSLSTMVVSNFMGLTFTAIYGNYYYIYSALYSFMIVICNSMSASVGHSIVVESKDKNYSDLLVFSTLFSWFSGWCAITLFCLYQPFMKLWVGSELLLPIKDVALFSLYLYVVNMTSVRDQYISGTGIWWKLKVSSVFEILANLLLCILLGKFFGITGILITLIFTVFVFNFVWRNVVLFKHYFNLKKLIGFMKQHLYLFLLVATLGAFTYILCENIVVYEKLILPVRLIICIIMPNFLLFIAFHRSEWFAKSLNVVKKLVSKN